MAKLASISALSAIARPLSEGPEKARVEGRRPLWQLLEQGQVLELSGASAGKLSVVARLIGHAQQKNEIVAYIAPRGAPSMFFPDLVAMGIDLAALVLVRMPETAGPHGVVRAAEVLLRSGAFGLVVIDLGAEVPKGELGWQSRLTGLLRMHGASLVLLTATQAEASSLGPLVALRSEPRLQSTRSGRVVIEQRVLKNKLGELAEPSPDVRRWPEGAE